MLNLLKKLTLSAVVISVATGASDSHAVTLSDGLVADPGVFWNDLPTNSFDSASWNQFYSQLAPFIDQQAYILPATFSAGAVGDSLNYLQLVEIAGSSDVNALEICTTTGCDTAFSGTDSPGTTSSTPITTTDDYWFRFNGPSNSFYSDASLNVDGLTHFYAFKVVTAGEVTLSPVTLTNNPTSVTLTLAVGDLIIGVEDVAGLYPYSDRDFNDMLFRAVTTNEVPEPMSLMLLGAGALGALRLRRRTAA